MLDQELEKIALDLSVPIDSLKAGVGLISSYLFAILFSLIPAKAVSIRHAFSILTSIATFMVLFDYSGILEVVGTSLAVYLIALYGKTNKRMPIVTFAVVMGHLSFALLRTQVFATDSARFDVTAPMMVLVIKLSAFGWSVHDATRPESELSKEQKIKAVYKFPSLLEYFGFVFFFPSFLVGPALEFRDYQAFINVEAPFDQMPSRIIPVLTSLFWAAVALFLYVKCAVPWSFYWALTPEYLQLSIFQRWCFLQMAGFVSRTKFYVAWKLSEGACNLTGIGYSGKDPVTGKHVWTRANNVNLVGVELGDNAKTIFDAWNQKTASWLRNYVYLRMTPPGKKPHPMVAIITYMVSAFWHGFYPGYYLTFFAGAFLNLAGRNMRRSVRPIFMGPSKLAFLKPIYDVLGWFFSLSSVNFLVAPFQVWSLSASLHIWSSVGYIPVIVIFFLGGGIEVTGFGAVVRSFGRAVGATYGKPTEVKVALENGSAMDWQMDLQTDT
ncbi:MBOAT, membrane-bound O-acyltransferase family-domain-containing protein [Chytridium lagenaria]|nr:MBOAT, membrane-bound O-acyltransferase family-domain-containing protein [Chytridium lagenaria]